MKRMLVAAAAVALASPAFAQAGGNMNGMSNMQGNMPGMDHGAMVMAEGEGTVKAVDPGAGAVTLQHGPIAALKWPAMTMTFKASTPALLKGVSVGQTVRFELMQMGGAITLTAIQPQTPESK